ncbi:MAG: sigma-70 family RNA polymerase sigma factor [Actinobacteria bacterium]|nr:sigma-70 family RNA polymerase sigma factor [Actinomycetota bacterium]
MAAMVRDTEADAEIVERLLARDELALRDVIELYGGVVHGMARRVVAETSMAEEVAQDAFLALWRRPGAFDPARGSLRAFLLGVTRNKAIDLVRREQAHHKTSETLAREAETASRHASPHEQVGERQFVRDALGQLTHVQREALVLAYFGGRTYREVAEELGIPEGTAKTRLRDGMTKLRELMGSSSITDNDPRGS